MLIDINNLIPTHNRLRNKSAVDRFLSDVDLLHRTMANKDDKVTVLDIDNKLYVHNGHHRLTAYSILFDTIDSELLNITKYTVQEMLTKNISIGWVTPFDPEFYCRVPNFKDLKAEIIRSYERAEMCMNKDTKAILIQDAERMAGWVIETRKIQTLRELYYESN
jgi:hypothetical protein